MGMFRVSEAVVRYIEQVQPRRDAQVVGARPEGSKILPDRSEIHDSSWPCPSGFRNVDLGGGFSASPEPLLNDHGYSLFYFVYTREQNKRLYDTFYNVIHYPSCQRRFTNRLRHF